MKRLIILLMLFKVLFCSLVYGDELADYIAKFKRECKERERVCKEMIGKCEILLKQMRKFDELRGRGVLAVYSTNLYIARSKISSVKREFDKARGKFRYAYSWGWGGSKKNIIRNIQSDRGPAYKRGIRILKRAVDDYNSGCSYYKSAAKAIQREISSIQRERRWKQKEDIKRARNLITKKAQRSERRRQPGQKKQMSVVTHKTMDLSRKIDSRCRDIIRNMIDPFAQGKIVSESREVVDPFGAKTVPTRSKKEIADPFSSSSPQKQVSSPEVADPFAVPKEKKTEEVADPFK